MAAEGQGANTFAKAPPEEVSRPFLPTTIHKQDKCRAGKSVCNHDGVEDDTLVHINV